MSAAALGVATTLQNRVVGALGSAQNLLPPPEYNSALLQAGAVGVATQVLGQLKEGQEKLTELTTNIATILKEQLTIAEEQQRRERDKSGQLTDPNTGLTMPVIQDNVESSLESGGFNLGNLLSGGLGAIFGAGGVIASGAAARFAKGLGKGLVKGGFYGLLASFLAKPAIDFLEEGILKYDIPDSEEEKMEQAIISAVALAGIFGPKGALIGLLGFGLKGIYDVLTDPEKGVKDLTKTEIASLAVGTIGTGIVFGPSIMKGLKKVGFNTARMAKLGGLIAAPPFIIAGGIALAAGAGAKLLVDKMNDIEQTTLDHLSRLMKLTQEEFETELKNQEAGFLEKSAPGIQAMISGGDSLTTAGQNVLGTKAALDDINETGQVDVEQKPIIMAMAEKYSRLSQKDLMDIMMSKQGLDDLLTVANNLRTIALKGGLGNDSKAVAEDMLKLGDKIKRAAGTLIDRGVTQGHLRQQLGIIERGELGLTSRFGSVDILEKVGTAEQKLFNLNEDLVKAQADFDLKKANLAKLEDADASREEIKAAKKELKLAKILVRDIGDEITQTRVKQSNLFTSLDIKYEDLEKIFSPTELKELIKSNMMTGAQQIDKAMKDFREIESKATIVNAPVSTDVNTTSRISSVNQTLNGATNHHMDQHLDSR